MLLNVVKLRYGDAPVFLDVVSVITQTGYQGTVGVSGILVAKSLATSLYFNRGCCRHGDLRRKADRHLLAA